MFLEVTDWRVFCGPASLSHKIDLDKVFDRIEWDLILSAVTNLGLSNHFVNLVKELRLSNHFVNLVKECITSTKLSILVLLWEQLSFYSDNLIICRLGLDIEPALLL